MATMTRYEFTGSLFLLLIMFISIFGIPFGVLYLIENVVAINEPLPDPAKFRDVLADRRHYPG